MIADPILRTTRVDLGALLRTTLHPLHTHLVTRPTGRALRRALEIRLGDARETLLLVDLSQVMIIDFSCADEVVAKLLLHYLDPDRPAEIFFVFLGIGELHRDPIEVVLDRHDLAAVAEGEEGGYDLLGRWSSRERRVWELLESKGGIDLGHIRSIFPRKEEREALETLVERRLVFLGPRSGRYHSLGTLARDGRRRE